MVFSIKSSVWVTAREQKKQFQLSGSPDESFLLNFCKLHLPEKNQIPTLSVLLLQRIYQSVITWPGFPQFKRLLTQSVTLGSRNGIWRLIWRFMKSRVPQTERVMQQEPIRQNTSGCFMVTAATLFCSRQFEAVAAYLSLHFFIMIHLIRVIKLIRRRCWSCVGCVTFASLLKVRLKCRLGTSPRVLLSRKDCNLFPRPPLHNDRTLAFIFHPSLSPLGGSLMYWRSLIPQE